LAKDSIEKRPKFYHVALSQIARKHPISLEKTLVWRACVVLKCSPSYNTNKGRVVDTRKLGFLCALVIGAVSFDAAAQTGDGYVSAPPAATTWKSGSGACVRTGYWTPGHASSECDPDLVPRPRTVAAPPPPPPPPAPAPIAEAPKPAPIAAPAPRPAAAPKAVPLTLGASELFGFNQATLTAQGRKKLDAEVIERSRREYSDIKVINVNGHTDRIGAPEANQKLSQRRADAVKAYLVAKGFDPAKIETHGFGKTMPVKSCPAIKERKALIDCLAPNRRVEIEIQGAKR
jgi:OmpA-OmpF porin, OOP family